jgi:lysophospholipase L1-like esterase
MRSICIITLVLASSVLVAQPAFQDEIKAFERLDSLQDPPKNATLFIGSSSFRLWENVQHEFPKHHIINRGFGGSTLEDVIHYTDQIIFPYAARQIVIYCGENDIASGASPHTVLDRFDKLFSSIRRKQPKVPVIYVSMKPSPSRENLMDDMSRGNDLIREYLDGYKQTYFVDVFSLMLDEAGKPRPELFKEDMLHLNEDGYAIWKKAILPKLK